MASSSSVVDVVKVGENRCSSTPVFEKLVSRPRPTVDVGFALRPKLRNLSYIQNV